jgi:tetratricopeptide (TPR) repeat protein
LENLADTFELRGDLDQAEVYGKRALTLWERLDPEGLSLAGALVDVSVNLMDRGDLARAELFLHRALAIQKKLAPNGGGVASSSHNLGLLMTSRGQLAEAEELFKQSLAIRPPSSLLAASHMENLGEVVRRRGDLAEAEKCCSRPSRLKRDWPEYQPAFGSPASPFEFRAGMTFTLGGERGWWK